MRETPREYGDRTLLIRVGWLVKSAVIQFPGSNCERDSFTVLEQLDMSPTYVWHGDASLPDTLNLVVIPGGFSYGDYLRAGAMAAHSPIMTDIIRFAKKRRPCAWYLQWISNLV